MWQSFLSNFKKNQPPFSEKTALRILIVVLVIVSLLGGYYHSLLDVYKRKYFRLENQLIKSEADLAKCQADQ